MTPSYVPDSVPEGVGADRLSPDTPEIETLGVVPSGSTMETKSDKGIPPNVPVPSPISPGTTTMSLSRVTVGLRSTTSRTLMVRVC